MTVALVGEKAQAAPFGRPEHVKLPIVPVKPFLPVNVSVEVPLMPGLLIVTVVGAATIVSDGIEPAKFATFIEPSPVARS